MNTVFRMIRGNTYETPKSTNKPITIISKPLILQAALYYISPQTIEKTMYHSITIILDVDFT